jgi:hypothetical protein
MTPTEPGEAARELAAVDAELAQLADEEWAMFDPERPHDERIALAEARGEHAVADVIRTAKDTIEADERKRRYQAVVAVEREHWDAEHVRVFGRPTDAGL